MFGFETLSGRMSPLATMLALTFAAAPLAAAAQDVPSYAQPSYAASTDETVHGRIRSVDGAFTLTVADDRGFVDNVTLHQGTIINPTGLTLSPGMSVTILGVNAGSTFDANEIDTPYTYDGPLPTPVYYGSGYWCPGFAYGYGPSFSLALVIGGGGYRPWYYEHRPFYGRPWDGHGYFGGHVGYEPANRIRFEERRPSGNEHSAPAHAPAAFAGRSFAGEAERGEPRSTYNQEVQTQRFSSTKLERAGEPRAQRQPMAGGYERNAAAGGFERGNVPAGGFERGTPRGGAAGGGPHGGPASHGGGGHSH